MLRNIKVLDPACGSGAFLVKVFDYLLAENTRVSEILGHARYQQLGSGKIKGSDTLFDSEDFTKGILQNNIYGVDINAESVEITKLSLWLKTAQKGKKLATLKDNIKCGNSLIDDPEVAGDKAFKWDDEFKDIMGSGGFDVVVGNPPYLRIQGLKDAHPKESLFYEKNYQSATGKYDIYVLFMEKGHTLLTESGKLGFILPHKFLVSDFGKGIRKYFIEHKAVETLLHFGSEIVFKDATTYTCIVKLSHQNDFKLPH